jgi:DNA-binding NtrC family response regulator
MGERPRILIVDDDEGIRTVLAAVLEEKGYTVDTAENGKEAIEKTQTNLYNLALIDIRLPDMEGTQVLAKMKDTTPKMRKIIITGFPSVQNSVEALNKGAHAYIMKPFDMDKALKTVEEQLKKQQEEKKYGQEKVTEYIETRVKELEEKVATQEKPRQSLRASQK